MEYNILDFVPQRPPFLLVDGILALSDEVARTKKLVTAEDALSVSGTYVLEHMAQSAAALFAYRNGGEQKKWNHLYLAGVEYAEVNRTLGAGEQLITDVKVTLALKNWCRVTCESFVGDGDKKKSVASASLTLYMD